MALDQAQHLQRIEPRRQHQGLADPQRHLGEHAGRAMVDRRGQQCAAAGPQTVRLLHHRLDRRQPLRQLVQRKRRAHHALRPAGGAGGIGHVAARRHHRAVVGRLRLAPAGVILGHGSRAHATRRQVRRQRRSGGLPQVFLGDQQARAAVAHQVGNLVGRVMPVDRAVIAAQALAGLDDLQVRHAVAQQHRHHVALPDPHGRQARRDLLAATHQGRAVQLAVAGDDAAGPLRDGCAHAWPAERCALSAAVRASMAARAAAQSSSDQSKYCLKYAPLAR